MKKIIILFALIALILSGCTQNQAPQEKLVVGLNYYVGEGPFVVAAEKGYFDEQGIEVEYFWSPNPAIHASAFVGQKIDMYHFTADALAMDAGNGLEGTMVWVSSSSNGADGIIANDSIQSVIDLKGKKVGYQQGGPTHYLLSRILENNGMTLNDIQSINLDPDKAAEAFFAQELDAAGTWEPWLTKAKELPNTTVVLTSAETPELILDVLIVRNDVLENNPELVAKFFKGLQKGIDYEKTHPEEAAEIAASTFQLSPEEYLEAVTTIDFKNVADNQRLLALGGPAERIAVSAGLLWKKEGLIKTIVPAQQLVSNSIVQMVSADAQ